MSEKAAQISQMGTCKIQPKILIIPMFAFTHIRKRCTSLAICSLLLLRLKISSLLNSLSFTISYSLVLPHWVLFSCYVSIGNCPGCLLPIVCCNVSPSYHKLALRFLCERSSVQVIAMVVLGRASNTIDVVRYRGSWTMLHGFRLKDIPLLILTEEVVGSHEMLHW